MRVQIPTNTSAPAGDRIGEVLRTMKITSRAFRPVKEYEIAIVRLDRSGQTFGVILADCEVVS